MGERFTQDGVIYETMPNGNVRVVGYADAPASSGIVVKQADPARQFEAPKAAADLQRTQQQIAQTAATAPYDAQKASADARAAQAAATKAERDLAATQATATPEQQKGMQALANDEVLRAIQKAREGVDAGWSAGYVARLPEWAQPQNAIDLGGALNTIASRLTLDKLAQLKQASPTGASGLGSLTEKEGSLLRDSVAALGQTQSPEKLLESLGNVEKHYRNVMALSAGEDYRNPQVAAKYGIAAAPDSNQPNALATGAYRDEADPALKGVNNRIRSLIGNGAKPEAIVAYMNSVQPGLGDQRAGDVAKAVQFRAQNPKVPLDRYSISVENRSVPMSPLRQTLNMAAQSPVGAYTAAVADTLSLGTIDNMQDNPALARAGMAQISRDNPVSSLAGTLTGGAMAGALGEGAVAGLGRAAPYIADAVLGGGYGAGSADEGSRLSGAAWGALAGGAGGEVGRRGVNMLGTSLRGVQNEAAQTLRGRGVPLTIGQIRGGAAKAKEDRLLGYGGIGDRILNQRREGVRGFNQAAFDEALAPIGQQSIGQVGEEGIDTARTAISGPGGAYDRALSGVALTPDQPFATDVGGALARGTSLPRVGPEFRAYVDQNIAPHFSAPSGQIDGRQMQDIIQQSRGANFGTDSMGSMASGAMRDIEGAVADLANRQAPQAMPALGNANTAYRNLNILADAVGKGANSGGLFTPAQLGTAARMNTTRFGGKIAAATPERPFFDLQRAGRDVLPSTVPDSGTAGRIAENGGIFASMRKGVRNAKGAMVYNDLLQEPITRALLDRTPEMVRAGEFVQRQARRGRLLGAPVALNYGPLAVSDY